MEKAIQMVKKQVPRERMIADTFYTVGPTTASDTLMFVPSCTLNEFLLDRPWLKKKSQKKQEQDYRRHNLSCILDMNEVRRLREKELRKVSIEIRAKQLLEKKNN